MFNIFEGNKDETARKLQERLEILKRAREDGFFDEERIEPMPEIVADGHGPDDRKRPSPFVKKQATHDFGKGYCQHAVSKELSCGQCGRPVADPEPTPHKCYTSQPCNNCDGYTRHIDYGTVPPAWHCVVCCICDFCVDELTRQDQARDQVKRWGESTAERTQEQVAAGHEALYDTITAPDQLFFCTKCGAGLRCGVCNNTGTGRYCNLCGRRDTGEGFCTDCWKEADLDG